MFQLFQHQHPSTFAENEAVALAVERARHLDCGPIRSAQRAQSGVSENQQRINSAISPAGQDDVGIIAGNQAKCFADGLRAGGAGGGDCAVGALSVQRQRDVGGHHVRQIFENPQREESFGALLAEPRSFEIAVGIAGIDQGRGEFGQIDGDQTGAHDDADALGVFAVEIEAGILNTQAGGADGEAHGARHDL